MSVGMIAGLLVGAFWLGQYAHRLDTVEREQHTTSELSKSNHRLLLEITGRLQNLEEKPR